MHRHTWFLPPRPHPKIQAPNPKLQTSKTTPESRNMKPETRTSNPGTGNSQAETQHPNPESPNPDPETPRPKTGLHISNPESSTPNPRNGWVCTWCNFRRLLFGVIISGSCCSISGFDIQGQDLGCGVQGSGLETWSLVVRVEVCT